jgi:SAM-dependent methyltransferase
MSSLEPLDPIERWAREERQPFAGWDFAYLAGRVAEDAPPWSYAARAAELMRHATVVVDLDTGGGERLLELREHWPRRVVATEGYSPNARLAAARFAPLGVPLIAAKLGDDELLPFADRAFGLVLDRHAAFNPAEVARVLAPGGAFLTQQVHGRSLEDLMAIFGARPQWPDATLDKYVPRLAAAGLAIVAAHDWSGRMVFADVGAIVYYLKHVPWLVPDFSVARYAEQLLRLQAQRDRGEALAYTARSYLIEARKEPVVLGLSAYI